MKNPAEIPEDVLDALLSGPRPSGIPRGPVRGPREGSFGTKGGGPETPPVIVAVSGGPDSVALALLLDDARRSGHAPRLVLAHLNHRIRGDASERDAAFVRALAEKLGLDAIVDARDVPAEAARRKLSLEHAARECRYEFLERVARETGARWVAVGHTADDQLETVLHNILRGAGIHGLAGMPRERPLSPLRRPEPGERAPTSDARIIRPLLDVPRRDLLALLSARGQDFRVDETNRDVAFTRNRIRHVLIPALEADWPTLREDIADFARELRALDALLDRRAAEWLGTSRAESHATSAAALRAVGEPLASTIVRALIARALGDLRRIDEVHVRMVLELAAAEAPGASLDLPRGLTVRREYDALVFEKREPGRVSPPASFPLTPSLSRGERERVEMGEATLAVPGELAWGEWVLRAQVLEDEAVLAELREPPEDPRDAARALIRELKERAPADVQYLDFDRAGCDKLTVRARRPGDRFAPLGSPGHTKLKDFFIRRKVPHADRDRLPLVVAGGRIVAIATLAVSNDAALTERTTRVLKLTASSL